VADLAAFVPSLTINQANNNRNSSIIIRDVGTAGTNPGTEADVGVFMDGVFIPVAGPIYGEVTDISTIEVLRGPQGTLYGRNTPVGAININTRAPSDTTEGMVDVQYGNFDQVRIAGYFGGAIADNLDGRVTGWTDSHSGYLKNIYTDGPVWNSDKYGGRARLRWTPDSDTTVDFISYYSYMSSDGTNGVQVDPLGPGGIVYGYNPVPTSFAKSPFVIAEKATNPSHPYVVPGPWQVDSATPAYDKTTMWGASVNVSRTLPINATISNLLAYNSYNDFSPNVGPGQLPLDIATNLQADKIGSVSDELRLVSGDKRFIDYVTGLYFFHDDLQYAAQLTIDSGANRNYPAAQGGPGGTHVGDQNNTNFHQGTTAFAPYGQATMNISDDFRLIGGLRYSYDHKNSSITSIKVNVAGNTVSGPFIFTQGPNASLTGRLTNRSLTWMYGAQYDIRQDVMAYFTASSGFKDGGFNSRSASVTPYAFNPETSLNYEIGLKSTWFDNRLLLNLDVFRTLVYDYQQSTLLPIGTGFAIGNAGNFRNQGVELDAQAQPIDELSLNASGSYIDSVITGGAENLTCDNTYPFQGSAPPSSSGPYSDATHKFCNFNGLTLPFAPKWHWSVGGKWEQNWMQSQYSWYVSADLSGQSSSYLDPSLDPRALQKGYALFDASIGFEPNAGNWKIDFWGKNLANKRYFTTMAPQTQAAQVSGGGTAPANGFIGWLAQPRTFGVEASYKF
jgi:iron complex outermembrane receptor protein